MGSPDHLPFLSWCIHVCRRGIPPQTADIPTSQLAFWYKYWLPRRQMATAVWCEPLFSPFPWDVSQSCPQCVCNHCEWANSPACNPHGFLPINFLLTVKEFGSWVSKWLWPAAFRQHRCLNFCSIKRPSSWQSLLTRLPLWLLFFIPIKCVDCWCALHKAHLFIQTLGVGMRACECLSPPLWFCVKARTGKHLFPGSGWAAVQADGNVTNSWSWSKDCQGTCFTALIPFLAQNK